MSETLLMKYAEGIPKDLLYIFIPGTVEGLQQLEDALMKKARNKPVKEAAKKLRLKYQDEFPPSARRWPLRYITTRVIILLRKRKSKWRDSADDGFDEVQ